MSYNKTEKSRISVSYGMIDTNTEYHLLVSPLYRNEAAKVIQHAIRNRLQRNNILDQYQRLDYSCKKTRTHLATSYLQNINHKNYVPQQLTEIPDDAFNQTIIDHIQHNQYEAIDYELNDFTRRLFAILRQGQISLNQMMTAKLLYEARLCFQNNVIRRFQLNDKKGPYQPSQEMGYWDADKSTMLTQLLENPVESNNNYYYTIDLPNHYVSAFLYDSLDYSNRNIFVFALKLYIQTLPNNKKALSWINDLSPRNRGLLKAFIKQHEQPKTQSFVSCEYNQSYFPSEYTVSDFYIERVTCQFFSNLLSVHSYAPSLCVSPHYKNNDNHSPLMSFVIPTLDTLYTLQKIVHGEEATYAFGTVGKINAKMIRAYDEVPAERLNPTELKPTVASQLLVTLFPSAKHLKSHSRPIELTHPDVEKTFKPHGSDCHDFFLTWHDVFHAWRSGENYKLLMRKLRRLHDDKAGLASLKNKSMSRSIWLLSDVDFNLGTECRMHDRPNTILQHINNVFKRGGFDLTQKKDDNYLLIDAFCTYPDVWKPLLCGLSDELGVGVDDTMRNNLLKNPFIFLWNKELLIAQQSLLNYRKTYPSASIVQMILNDLLEPYLQKDEVLLHLNQDDYKDIFYWSANTGLFFKPACCNLVAEQKPKLRDNSADIIHKVLSIIVEQQHQEKATCSLSSMC